jgi:hypothetical protein
MNVSNKKTKIFSMSDPYKKLIYSLVRAKESNFFTEENFYILHWLYRIRKEKCSRGNSNRIHPTRFSMGYF